MAIRMQCSADAPGAELNAGWSKPDRPVYTRETHKGLVIRTYERNYHDDSDFYAVVWNPEKGEPEHIQYATTRGWTYANGAAVDATPEVLAAYEAYEAKRKTDEKAAREAAEAAIPVRGDDVEILRGKNKGKIGRIFWIGPNPFRTYWRKGYNRPEDNLRVGMTTAAGETLWTGFDNIRKVGAEQSAGEARFSLNSLKLLASLAR